MTKTTILTKSGYEKLVEELHYLKGEKMHDIAEQIKIAREFGDLKENSEYLEAKNEQGKIQTRIKKLDAMLKDVDIIENHKISTKVVGLGSTVKLLDIEFDEELEFALVGSTEAAPLNGKISNESPVGMSLLGNTVGDVVDVQTPNGVIKYKILEIHL